MRKQINRYTQREIEAVIEAMNAAMNEARKRGIFIDLVAYESALAKSKLRLRREKNRAK